MTTGEHVKQEYGGAHLGGHKRRARMKKDTNEGINKWGERIRKPQNDKTYKK